MIELKIYVPENDREGEMTAFLRKGRHEHYDRISVAEAEEIIEKNLNE